MLLRHTSVAAMPPAPNLLEDGPYQLLKLPILKQHRGTWALEFRRWVGWKPVVKSHVQFSMHMYVVVATCSDAGTSLARNRRPPPALAGRPSTRRQVLQEVRPMMLVRTCSQSRLSVSKFVNVIVTRLLQHIPLQAHHAQVQPAGGLDQSQLRHAVARHLS